MKTQTQKKSGGTRKHGRNESKCKVYKQLHRKEQSRIRKLERHIKKYKDNSPVVKEALEKYRQAIVRK